MKKYMSLKYRIDDCENLENTLSLGDNLCCNKICRYADGFVYRITEEVAFSNEPPWKCKLIFQSVTAVRIYKTAFFDRIVIHATDFEHGCFYATGIELYSDGARKVYYCSDEVWSDKDVALICCNT